LGEQPIVIKPGDRIAQLIIAPVIRADIVEVDELAPSARGPGGFGHTGR
jgi:dUTP pyrophosphatase